MQDSTFSRQKIAKVSFTYRGNAQQGQHSLEKGNEPPSKKIPALSLRPRPNSKLQIHNPQPTNHDDNQVHTLKKQHFEVDALSTTRKPLTFKTETDDPHLDCSRQHGNQVALLKEEIRFMRRKLVQSQTAQKDLRLQYQLYRANIEHAPPRHDNQSPSLEEIHTLFQKETPIFIQNQKLKQKIKDQQKNILDLQGRVIELNNSREKQQQLPDRTAEVQELGCLLQEKDAKIQSLVRQLDTLNEVYIIGQSHYSNELKLLQLQKQKLQNYLEEQKETRVALHSHLQKIEQDNGNYKTQVQELFRQVQKKNADIQFLNRQAYDLDCSLADAVKEREALVNERQEKQDRFVESQEALSTMRSKMDHFQEKAFSLEGEVERLALCIYEIRTKYENTLHNLSQELSIGEELKDRCQQLEESKYRLQMRQSEEQNKDVHKINRLQGQLARVKGENTHLRSSVQKLQSNEQVLLDQLEWIRKEKEEKSDSFEANLKEQEKMYIAQINLMKREKEESHQRQVQQIKALQLKINEITVKFSEATLKYEQNLATVIKNYQNFSNSHPFSQKSPTFSESSSPSSPLLGHTLSKHQLSTVLKNLKSQPQVSQLEHQQLKEELQLLQQQLQAQKIAYQQQLRQVKNKYEAQINQNNEEYSEQLNVYTCQIEKLMMEMKEIKGQCEEGGQGDDVEIIHEEEGEDEDSGVDERKIKRDLMMHGEDPSDYYVSPPSSNSATPIKTISDQKNEQPGSSYILQDIIDLESKIHNYIRNFNKKRSKDSHEEES